MIIVVSPYHLVTREPPAMASLLLADQVVTLVPAPVSAGPAGARQAAARSPWYARFVEELGWSAPLWREGVLASQLDGDDPGADMLDVVDRIRTHEAYLPLRPLVREAIFENEHTFLSALGSDLTRGGPDPAVTVPLVAALDRFARRHRAGVARPQPISVVQRAEAALGTSVAAIALPLLVQASPERLLLARRRLADPLSGVRSALDRLARAVAGGETTGPTARELGAAGAIYASAFEIHAKELLRAPEDDIRPVAGSVVITAQALPVDAVLRSSLVAMDTLVAATLPAAQAPSGLALAGDDAGPVLSLTFKPMGQPTPPRSRR